MNRRFGTVILWMFISSVSFAQLPQAVTQLTIKRKPSAPIIAQPHSSILLFNRNTFTFSHTNAMGSYVNYPAFFCTMEQKSINKLGVCFQVHAGNYSNYMKR